jgi:hypothetical protein
MSAPHFPNDYWFNTLEIRCRGGPLQVVQGTTCPYRVRADPGSCISIHRCYKLSQPRGRGSAWRGILAR